MNESQIQHNVDLVMHSLQADLEDATLQPAVLGPWWWPLVKYFQRNNFKYICVRGK